MHPDTLGWTAAALMVATFSCREARHLRPLAVATNLAFIGYGAAAGLMPVLALHLLLLPINLWRWAQAVALTRQGAQRAAEQFGRLLCVMVMGGLPLAAGCGEGGGNDDAGALPSTSPTTPPSTGTPPLAQPAPTIGAAGGRVSLGDGAEVVVPAGALSTDAAIEVHAAPAGAPARPPGLMALGKVYAFTPHGTTFAVPARVTVPFDPSLVPSGTTPVLYKAEASGPQAGQWNEVPGALVQGQALQADGRIVVAGSSLNTATSFDFVVARFLADGTPDAASGSAGFQSFDFFTGRDGAYDVLVQPDGRLLVSGSAGSGLATLPILLRLFP